MADSVLNQLIIGRFVHYFFVSLCICSLNLFHFNIFSSLFSLMYWWMSASSNYISMHLLTHSLSFIVFAFIKMNFLGQSLAYILSCMPCMREISQWDGLLARLLAYTQLGWFSNRSGTPVDDGVRKLNNWLDQWQSGKLGTGSRVYSFPCAFPSSNDVPVLLLNQPINFSLIQSYVEQYSHIVPQLTEFRSIRLRFCRRSEERDSNRRWTRRSVGKNPWPMEKAWASANLR